jgi:hypothetical protein
MAISLEHAYDELRAALAGPEDDVFYDLIAISDGLLTSGHSDRDLEGWSTTAANGILERGISADKLSCYDTLDPRVSALIFHAADKDLVEIWPAKPLPNLLSISMGRADIDWHSMPDCEWRLLAEVLILSGPGISAGLHRWLARQHLPSLRTLTAVNVGATREDDLALAKASFWPALEEVNLSHNEIGGHGAWTAMPAIRSLQVPWTRTTNDDLRTLTAVPLPRLAHLDISGNPVDNTGFDLLRDRPFPVLEALVARGCEFSDGHAWRSLAGVEWPSLRRLDLQDSVRDPRDLRAASRVLSRLHELRLSSCELDLRGVQALADIELKELTSLDVSYNELTAAAGEALASAELPRLKHFHTSVTRLGDGGVAALTRAPWWRSLEIIGLVNVEMTDEGLRALTSALPSTLRELQLGSPKQFTPQALEALKNSLPVGATIW